VAGRAPVQLRESSPGHWQGILQIPSDAAPGLLKLEVTAHRAHDTDLTESTAVRIATTP
jgi:hypothetical protein